MSDADVITSFEEPLEHVTFSWELLFLSLVYFQCFCIYIQIICIFVFKSLLGMDKPLPVSCDKVGIFKAAFIVFTILYTYNVYKYNSILITDLVLY